MCGPTVVRSKTQVASDVHLLWSDSTSEIASTDRDLHLYEASRYRPRFVLPATKMICGGGGGCNPSNPPPKSTPAVGPLGEAEKAKMGINQPQAIQTEGDQYSLKTLLPVLSNVKDQMKE